MKRMTPNERQEFEALKKLVMSIREAKDLSFVESVVRRLTNRFALSDLSDVSGTDNATTGQVLKKTATTWQPGTDIDT